MSFCMMFACSQCDNLDSIRATEQDGGNDYRCHRCIKGYWHMYFAEEKYDPYEHEVINRPNTEYKGWGAPSFG